MWKFIRKLFQGTLNKPQVKEGPSWVLSDTRPMQEESPYTFFVPSDAEKAALEPGDLVRLRFEGDAGAERMWVLFKGRDEKGCFGVLDNEPAEISDLHMHDEVRFQNHHILSVYELKVTTNEEIAAEGKFFERCYVALEIIKSAAKISKAERCLPRDIEGESFPDTGWIIYAEGKENLPLEEMSYVAIGIVLNKDDGLLPFLEEPVGAVLYKTESGMLQAQ